MNKVAIYMHNGHLQNAKPTPCYYNLLNEKKSVCTYLQTEQQTVSWFNNPSFAHLLIFLVYLKYKEIFSRLKYEKI